MEIGSLRKLLKLVRSIVCRFKHCGEKRFCCEGALEAQGGGEEVCWGQREGKPESSGSLRSDNGLNISNMYFSEVFDVLPIFERMMKAKA